MQIYFRTTGSDKTEKALRRMSNLRVLGILDRYAREGVAALASVTPIESGLTANSWSYEISRSGRGYTITWNNSNIEDGVNIAVILQYGHGTGTGGYVRGQDYINPAIKPVFDKIADEVWKAVTRA